MNLYQMISRRLLTLTKLFLLTIILTAAIQAQTSGVDLSFNAIPDKNATSAANFILQPDNKIIVFGDFQVVNGVIGNHIARLNTDGSLDNSFNCAACDFNIGSAVLQPDGKIIVAGAIYSADNVASAARLRRLNTDGSLDTSFAPASPFNDAPAFPQYNRANVWAVQPDGRILVTLYTLNSGFSNFNLYRLNTNGTIDTTFTTINVGGGRLVSTTPQKISVLPDGKILVARNTSNAGNTSGSLQRYNADGSLDSTFEAPSVRGTGSPSFDNSFISDFDFQSDGTVVIVGRFVSVNGVSRQNVAKLLPAGNVDLSFSSSINEEATKVKILPDGKVLISTINGCCINHLYRLNADGSLDNSFNLPTSLIQIYNFTLDSAGRIFLYGAFVENGMSVSKFARLNQDGSLESSFTVNFGIVGSITAIAVQADGKVVFAGDFIRVNGVSRVSIARVNSDGSLDTTFNSGSGFTGRVFKVLVQSDGKILVAGNIFSYNGTSRLGIVRLNADGTLDTNFNPNILSSTSVTVNTIALQPDGKILIGGFFSSVDGQARTGIARLNTDGTLDASFNPTFGVGSGSINSIVVQPDGKIIVGGAFSGVNGFNRTNLVRLNADGSLDSAFNAGNISPVNQTEVQTDGRYLVLTNTIVRLNNNGTTDATFQSPTLSGIVNTFLVQSDGGIIIGGSFTTINGVQRLNLARLRPNGTVDNSFFPTGANGQIRTMVKQADGKIIVGGDFTSVENVVRIGIARLNVGAVRAPFTLFDFDGDGKADISVFRPSSGVWYELRSQNNALFGMQFGQANDRLAPADYDGDGKADIAVFRDNIQGAGNFAYFFITNSSDNSFHPVQFGATGDIPVSGDWDGDGKADLAVYRDGSLMGGQSYFFYRPSSQPGVDFRAVAWGAAGDKPVMGDFDGDGKLDAAVFRPSNGVWYILKSSDNQVIQVQFGLGTDIPVPMDYNGDGITDIAVYRPSNGYWYIARSTANAAQNFDAIQFGAAGDLPVPADYDGDGKADVAVYRASNGGWYLQQSTNGFTAVQFGANNDKPIPNAYIR